MHCLLPVVTGVGGSADSSMTVSPTADKQDCHVVTLGGNDHALAAAKALATAMNCRATIVTTGKPSLKKADNISIRNPSDGEFSTVLANLMPCWMPWGMNSMMTLSDSHLQCPVQPVHCACWLIDMIVTCTCRPKPNKNAFWDNRDCLWTRTSQTTCNM